MSEKYVRAAGENPSPRPDVKRIFCRKSETQLSVDKELGVGGRISGVGGIERNVCVMAAD